MKLEQELNNIIFSLYYLTINKCTVNDWINNKFIIYSCQEEDEELKKPRKKARFGILNEVNAPFFLYIYLNDKVVN